MTRQCVSVGSHDVMFTPRGSAAYVWRRGKDRSLVWDGYCAQSLTVEMVNVLLEARDILRWSDPAWPKMALAEVLEARNDT